MPSATPPDLVIEWSAPGKEPSLSCIAARRLTAARAAPPLASGLVAGSLLR